MKTLVLIAVTSLAALQTAIPPQRGQVPNRAPVPLTAAQCRCSLEVTVLQAGSTSPIRDVDITASAAGIGNDALTAVMIETLRQERGAARGRRPGTASDALHATTDSTGRAVIHDLAEGIYTITAEREGYFAPARNGITPTIVTAAVSVGPVNSAPPARGVVPNSTVPVSSTPQPVQRVVLTLIPGGTISGRLLDSNRRPASGVPVGAFRVNYANGQRNLSLAAAAATTDDRGEYRLFRLPPGEYYLRTGTLPGPIARTQSYPVLTYYPGTSDPSMAVVLYLQAGQEMTGTDFSLHSVAGVIVSGNVINNLPLELITGAPVTGDAITGNQSRGFGPRPPSRTVSGMYLVPRNPTFIDTPLLFSNIGGVTRGGTATDQTSFPFEIRGVPPGSYDFYPIFTDGSRAAARGAGLRPTTYTGRTPVEVGSENINNVVSEIRRGVELKGRLFISDMPTLSQPFTFSNVRIGLTSIDNLPSVVTVGTSGSLIPDTDGWFTVSNMVDGRYIVSSVSGLPRDAYVSDLRLGTQRYDSEGTFSIGTATTDILEIVIKFGGQTIQGTVEDAQHKPIAATRVVLIPDAPNRQNLLLFKSTTSIAVPIAVGGFVFSGVAPGAYKLFAWENAPQGAELNSGFLREFEARGVSVIISPGIVPASVTVPLISDKL